MAVTVQASPSVILDAEYRIVGANQAARPWFEDRIGELVFDCFPGSESLFRPYYERARASGEPVEFAQFYGGYVTHILATPQGTDLVVTWTAIELLDTLTLEDLYASLDAALADLGHREVALAEITAPRPSLRLVEGGA